MLAGLALAAALVLLNASLTFANVWPTPAIRWQNALSIELAVIVLLLTVVRPSPVVVRKVLPAVWLVLVIGHYLDVTAPGIYGRDFNLYWDAPHIGNVVAMIAEAAPAWLIVATLIGATVAVIGAYAVSRLAWAQVADAVARPRHRAVLMGISAVIAGLFALQHSTGREEPEVVFADAVTTEYLHQIKSVVAMMGPGGLAPALGPSPSELSRQLGALNGSDVHLVFVESYGAITYDEPEIAAALAPSRAALAAAVRETGREAVSAYVESPTFGASSWLAHLTLMSGIRVADPYSYQSLMAEDRATLSTTFKNAGYRVVALMPGMRQEWPEGAFYRYDTIYGRDALDYTGPRFGWWSIPDQYSLAKLSALEGAPKSRPPLFVVFPTSTTHAPFGPVAPYQPDWDKVMSKEAYDAAEVEKILARAPDLVNLRGDYAHAMAYEFTTFAGYLRERATDDLVMILIGDHQPPAAVSGIDAPWTVPVHVIANSRSIIERLRHHGFTSDLAPTRPSLGQMHDLVPILLDAFASPGGTASVGGEMVDVNREGPR
jgi:hypothetical protein